MRHQCVLFSAKKIIKGQNTEVMKFNSRQLIHRLKIVRDFKIVHDGRLGRLDECHVTQNPRDI